MRHPVRQVLSVTAYGTEGEASLVDPADYEVDTLSRPARIHFERRPEPLRAMNGIEIDFSAGFGEAGTDVPDLLRRAILLLAATGTSSARAMARRTSRSPIRRL